MCQRAILTERTWLAVHVVGALILGLEKRL